MTRAEVERAVYRLGHRVPSKDTSNLGTDLSQLMEMIDAHVSAAVAQERERAAKVAMDAARKLEPLVKAMHEAKRDLTAAESYTLGRYDAALNLAVDIKENT